MEEQFRAQEEKRLTLEKQKQSLFAGTPIPGTVEELLNLYQAPVLLEFLSRTHSENHEYVNRLERLYERRFVEWQQKFEEQLKFLEEKVKEQQDNFNLYVSKSLDEQRLKRERLTKTCELIEREINL
jgi:hypothetical protein